MVHLIDKDALVAEIEKHLKCATNGIEYAQMGIDKGLEHYKEELAIWQHCQSMCQHILSFLNTLEVKEVDLEKALSDLDKDIKEFVTTEEFERESETCGHYWTIAKHAFLLGLKAQKGE